jgi:hypothetical protein
MIYYVCKTHLLDEVDAGLQVHTEVNELPLNAFLLVLFLLQHEHVVVEELLQTLVRVVDAQLLKRVVLEDLEASDIQHTDEPLALTLRVECLVDTGNKPLEHAVVQGLGQGMGGVDDLDIDNR